MAITAATRTKIIELNVLAGNGAPGTTELGALVATYNISGIAGVAASITTSASWTAKFPTFQTPEEFGKEFLEMIVPGLSAAGMAEGITIIAGLINSGSSQADVLLASSNFLSATSATDAAFGDYAAKFQNQTAVAVFHTVTQEKASPRALDDVTSDAATIVTAKADIDGSTAAAAAVIAAAEAAATAATSYTAAQAAADASAASAATATAAAQEAAAAAAVDKTSYDAALTAQAAAVTTGATFATDAAAAVTAATAYVAATAETDSADDDATSAAAATAAAASVTAATANSAAAAATTPTSDSWVVASAANVDEGSSVVFTVSSSEYGAGSSFNYSITGVEAADVVGGTLSGSASLGVDGLATVVVSLVADSLTDANTMTLTALGSSSSVVVNDTSTTAEVREFSLTTAANNANASANEGDTTFDATTTNSWNTFDTVRGGSGSDTITAEIADVTLRANMQGVENLVLTDSDAANVSTINMVDVTGLDSITVQTSVGRTVFSNMQTVGGITLSNTTVSFAAGYTAAATAGAADALTLNLSGVTIADNTAVSAATNTVETVNIVSLIATNTLYDLQTTLAGTTTVNISGDQDLTVTTAFDNEVLTINASTAEGDLNLQTGTGDTTVTLGSGSDVVVAQNGDNNISGGEGDDSITSGTGDDTLTGGAGADTIIGGAGADEIDAGAGDDLVQFAAAADLTAATVAGGDDADTVEITTADEDLVDADFAGVTGVETLSLADTGGNGGTVTVVLGTNAAAAGIANITVGDTDAAGEFTSIDSEVVAALAVDATAMGVTDGEDLLLTNTGTAGTVQTAFTVTGADGNVDASGTTAAVTVSFVDDANGDGDQHSFVAGTGLATVSGADDGDGGDTILITSASNVIATGPTVFSITGTANNDTIVGSDQADTIVGGAGSDNLTGGDGADEFQTTSALLTGFDTIAGGDGDDVLVVTDASTVVDDDFTFVTSVEEIDFSAGAGIITLGSKATNAGIATLTAGAGGDAIELTLNFTNNVTIVGGGGADTYTLSAFAGTADITGGAAIDTVTLGAGAATVVGGGGADVITGGAGALDYTGDAAIDTVTLGAGAATLDLAGGDDDIIIANGQVTSADTIVGGSGDDELIITDATTLTDADLTNVSLVEEIDADTNNVALTLTLGSGASGFTTITGGTADDTIIATEYGATLDIDTGLGDDSIVGSGNNDTVVGGVGDDTIRGGEGDDDLTGSAGNDVFIFEATGALNGTDALTFVIADDTLDISATNISDFSNGVIVLGSTADVNISNKVVILNDGAAADVDGDSVADDVDTATEIAGLIQGIGNEFHLTSGSSALILVGESGGQGNETQAWLVDDSVGDNAGTIEADDITLIGTFGQISLETITIANFVF